MLSELAISRLVARQRIYRLNQAIIAEEKRLNALQVSLDLAKEIYDTAKPIMNEVIFMAERPEEKATEARRNYAEALRKYNGYKAEYEKCNALLEKLKLELDKSTELHSNLSRSWLDRSALEPLSNEELAKAKEAFSKTWFTYSISN